MQAIAEDPELAHDIMYADPDVTKASITTTHLMRDLRCPFVPFVDLLPPAIAADPHYEAFPKRHNNPSL